MTDPTRNRLYDLYTDLIVSNEKDIASLIALRDALGTQKAQPKAARTKAAKKLHWSKRPENAERAAQWQAAMIKGQRKRQKKAAKA